MHHVGPLAAHVAPWAVLAMGSAAVAAVLVGSVLAPREAAAPVVMLSGRPADVARLDENTIAFCSELHTRVLPHGFFATLGSRFLGVYYRSFADSPHAVALIATVDGYPVGFLVGSSRARAHRQWVLRHCGFRLAVAGAVALLAHPRAAIRFARTRISQYRRRLLARGGDAGGGAGPVRDVAVLNHVAVLPGTRGVGAGRALVAAFESEARAGGAQTAYLTTLASEEGAGAFYEVLSWEPGPVRPTADGTRMQEWSKPLDSGVPA